MAEKMADAVARITKNPKFIRNICTSAHIHHGKCISGDSRVMIADGTIKTAREIYERVSNDGQVYQENEEYTIFIPNEKITIFSLNKNTGKLEKKPVQYVWRLNGGKTIKIALRNGFEITTTPEHKYIAYKDGFADVEAKNLRIGDRIVCAETLWLSQINANEIDIGNQLMLLENRLENNNELAYVEITKIESEFEDIVYDFTIPENYNFIAEGMVIHNTAFTDNLLAAAGHMASKYAGDLEEGMQTWQHKDEQERLMTVDAANVSMIHNFQDNEYLINLIDTPGHVDFGGNVTRAMRAIDGTVVLICAVEGIMPQTETVVKQALRERVKPVLFINKVDRLVKELHLTPEKIQERFVKLISNFNKLIESIEERELK